MYKLDKFLVSSREYYFYSFTRFYIYNGKFFSEFKSIYKIFISLSYYTLYCANYD